MKLPQMKMILSLSLLVSAFSHAAPMSMMDRTLMEIGESAHEASPLDSIEEYEPAHPEEIEDVKPIPVVIAPTSEGPKTIAPKVPAKIYYKEIIALTKQWRDLVPNDIEAAKLQCIQKSVRYYCQNSPVKAMSVLQRYELILAKLKSRLVAKKLAYLIPVLPCLMMRETGIFEPLIINGGNCDRSKFEDDDFRITDQGLGQITRTTFFKILGLAENEISPYLAGRLRISDARANGFRQLTTVSPYNSLQYRKNPLLMYNSLSNSIDFQLDVIIELMLWKKDQVLEENFITASHPDVLRLTLEKYNGSDKKEKYAKAVMACSTCLQGQYATAKKENAFICLGKSINKTVINSYPCGK